MWPGDAPAASGRAGASPGEGDALAACTTCCLLRLCRLGERLGSLLGCCGGVGTPAPRRTPRQAAGSQGREQDGRRHRGPEPGWLPAEPRCLRFPAAPGCRLLGCAALGAPFPLGLGRCGAVGLSPIPRCSGPGTLLSSRAPRVLSPGRAALGPGSAVTPLHPAPAWAQRGKGTSAGRAGRGGLPWAGDESRNGPGQRGGHVDFGGKPGPVCGGAEGQGRGRADAWL